MKKRTMLAAALLMAAKLAAAQEPKQWTLEECIDYAMANNISLQKSRLDKQSAIEDWKQAKKELTEAYERKWGAIQ